MPDKTHLPEPGINKRPHVPIETRSIGEIFRLMESGESTNKPDADYTSLQRSLARRQKKGGAIPTP